MLAYEEQAIQKHLDAQDVCDDRRFLSRQILIPTDYNQKKYHITLNYESSRTRGMESIQIPAHALGVVNGAVVLYHAYDPDQYWLPCCAVVLASAPPTAEERARMLHEEGWQRRHPRDTQHNREQIANRLRSPPRLGEKETSFARMHEDQEPQRFLPFREIQQCSTNDYRIVKRSWDLNGKPPKKLPKRLRYATLKDDSPYLDKRVPLEIDYNCGITEITQWLAENIAGRFCLADNGRLIFERYEDWLHARLRWQGANE